MPTNTTLSATPWPIAEPAGLMKGGRNAAKNSVVLGFSSATHTPWPNTRPSPTAGPGSSPVGVPVARSACQPR